MKIKQALNHGKLTWMVDLGKVDGKRQRKFFDNQAEAKTFLESKRIHRQNSGLEALHLSHRKRVEYINAEERLAEVGASITDAVNFYLKHTQAVTEMPLNEAINICVEAKRKSGKRKRSVQQLSYSLMSLARAFPDFNCSDITTEIIDKWIHKQNWSLRSIRVHLINYNAFFEFSRKRGWIPNNPCKNIEKIKLEEVSPAILTPDEAFKLLKAALEVQREMIPYLTLCLFCGLRRSEAIAIQWNEVDIDSGYVEVKAEKAKTRHRRIVTIPENAKAWLKLGGDLPAINVTRRWLKILKASGLNNWQRNAMRHSFCSYHLAFHGSAAKTALEAGHSETMLFQHYRELVKADQAREYWEIWPLEKIH